MFDDIEELSAGRLSHPEQALVVAHYQLAAPLLEANFSHVPLVSSYHPQGLGTPAGVQAVVEARRAAAFDVGGGRGEPRSSITPISR